jgi:hypothetical protein
MRTLILVVSLFVPALALAQQPTEPTPPAAAPSAPPAAAPPAAPPAAAPAAPGRSAAELRQICADALNADPGFASDIVGTVNNQTREQHLHAADAIAKNERHVILAYAAMWIVAAGFVIFMWRRQQALRGEIAMLRRDLEAATKETK